MTKIIKIFLLLLITTITFSLIGCKNESLPATDSYTVVFEDYDGTVLKTINCTVGETCEIVPPTEPNSKENCYFTRWSMFESQFDSIDRDTTIKALYTYDNRVITIGKESIVFYSTFIITGIIIALGLSLKEAKKTGIKQDDLIDGFLWIVPVAILGARLWYVAFEPRRFIYGDFFSSVLRVLGFQSGTIDFSTFGLSGLAIHGAFVTAVICVYFFTKKRKIDIFKVLDIIAVGFIIAQAFGRWGNFFNQEAHGGIVGGMTGGVANLSIEQQFNYLRYTLHLPTFIVNNMYIVHTSSVAPIPGYYHPTFFYESSINIIGFTLMLILRRKWKNLYFGELMSFYLIWYGGLRIFIETMRTDPLTFVLFGITFKSAIVTSVIMMLLGITLSLLIRMKRKGMTYGTLQIASEENVLQEEESLEK